MSHSRPFQAVSGGLGSASRLKPGSRTCHTPRQSPLGGLASPSAAPKSCCIPGPTWLLPAPLAQTAAWGPSSADARLAQRVCKRLAPAPHLSLAAPCGMEAAFRSGSRRAPSAKPPGELGLGDTKTAAKEAGGRGAFSARGGPGGECHRAHSRVHVALAPRGTGHGRRTFAK